MNGFPWLTCLTLVPLLGGLVLMGWGRAGKAPVRAAALGIWGVTAALVLGLGASVDLRSGTLQAVERYVWVPTLGVEYYVGVDGLGWVLLLLTVVVSGLALFASAGIHERTHLYHGLILCLVSTLFGAFTALNFVHWFLFWELSLIPAFFLVRLWGGPHRQAASMQFFLFTLAGSVVMLLGFLVILLGTGQLNFPDLARMAGEGSLWPAVWDRWAGWGGTAAGLALAVMVAVLVGLAVKVPMMPLHTWLPATYTEAATPVTMLLTGAMSKMGVYGLVRVFLPIFQEPLREAWPWLVGLAVWTIVASACAALAQRDLKRMLAYSSVNHLGYCLLAVFALGSARSGETAALHQGAALNGVILQMFNHGLTAATLFWCVGLLETGSGGRRGLDEFGGLRAVAPVFCGLMGISAFASLGLPGLNGFVGEFLIFRGVFSLVPWGAVLAVPGLLVTAVFLLRMMQRVFHGPVQPACREWREPVGWERWALALPVAGMLLLGLWPQLLLQFTQPCVMQLLGFLRV